MTRKERLMKIFERVADRWKKATDRQSLDILEGRYWRLFWLVTTPSYHKE